MLEELKQFDVCPFCGWQEPISILDMDYQAKHMHCIQCGADGPKKPGFRWNDRVDATPTDALRVVQIWLNETNQVLSAMQTGMERSLQSLEKEEGWVTKEICHLRDTIRQSEKSTGNFNSRVVYLIKCVKKLLKIP